MRGKREGRRERNQNSQIEIKTEDCKAATVQRQLACSTYPYSSTAPNWVQKHYRTPSIYISVSYTYNKSHYREEDTYPRSQIAVALGFKDTVVLDFNDAVALETGVVHPVPYILAPADSRFFIC